MTLTINTRQSLSLARARQAGSAKFASDGVDLISANNACGVDKVAGVGLTSETPSQIAGTLTDLRGLRSVDAKHHLDAG